MGTLTRNGLKVGIQRGNTYLTRKLSRSLNFDIGYLHTSHQLHTPK